MSSSDSSGSAADPLEPAPKRRAGPVTPSLSKNLIVPAVGWSGMMMLPELSGGKLRRVNSKSPHCGCGWGVAAMRGRKKGRRCEDKIRKENGNENGGGSGTVGKGMLGMVDE